jgi:hypothetical protein
VLRILRALEPLLAGLHRRGVRELGRHGCWWRGGGRRRCAAGGYTGFGGAGRRELG